MATMPAAGNTKLAANNSNSYLFTQTRTFNAKPGYAHACMGRSVAQMASVKTSPGRYKTEQNRTNKN